VDGLPEVYVPDQGNLSSADNESVQQNWSEDEKRLLRHEAFISEVVRLRTRSAPDKKPVWLLFLESNGGAALITAVLGALLVQWISGNIQRSLKEREFQQAWMQARGNQALAAYKEELDQEEQIVRRAYELIGSTIQASEDLIDLSGQELSLKTYKPSERKKIAKQRDRIRTAYNKADIDWRGQRKNLSLLMALYHHGQLEIVREWQGADDAIPIYMDCALAWYDAHHDETPETLKTACVTEKKSLTDKLDQLTATLGDFRSKARGDWESPDKLVQKLEKAIQR
jgi:hypothetical protein